MVRADTDAARAAVRINWRIATAAAAVLALLFASQNTSVLGFRQSYLNKLEANAVNWALWLALLPAIFAVAARAHERPIRDWRNWTYQLVVSVTIVVAHSAVVGAIQWATRPAGQLKFVTVIQGFVTLSFASSLMRYWLIAAVYHLLAYHHEVRRRDVNDARMAQRLAEAKLESLQARLQPHFLFNALNTITALIRKDPPSAAAMVGQLSELLRAALNAEGGREVTLAGELHLLDQYMAIQRTRFQDRLTFSVDAPPETLAAFVPQMILQPIVENAVRHGVGPREAAGAVNVCASRRGDTLRLIVRDDGVGFGNAPAAPSGSGIGLRGTQARLAHLYGDDYSFDIRAGERAGTVVTIDMPFHDHDLRVSSPA